MQKCYEYKFLDTKNNKKLINEINAHAAQGWRVSTHVVYLKGAFIKSEWVQVLFEKEFTK
ncbi:MAG: DUF4177 domain-containing protein [Mycoplasma sp.]